MKLSPLILLVLFFFAASPRQSSAACHPDDEAGLLGFKSGIAQDPTGILTSWKPSTDCCKWSGITCDSNNRVTSISVYGQANQPNSYLSGTISPALSKIQNLNSVYFQNLKNISGRFPDFLFKLPKLLFVYIENNKLSGPLPQNIGQLKQLGALSFQGNRFTGPIPSSISALTSVTQLKLGQNLLSGSVPVGIGQLKSLTFLDLSQNRLTGPIPDVFKSLTDLRILRLSRNYFTGQIPASISALAPNLQFLELGRNALTGKIPDFLGNFKTLDTLDLSWNKLAGPVPKSFGNLTKIFNLDLSRNLLTDPFPQMFVKGIESLDLSHNQFYLKEIPNWVTSSPIIYSLKLVNCGLQFDLNNWNPAETYFYDYIDLSHNQISGSPVNLLNKTDYLVEFRAAKNKLKFDLGKLRIVETLKNLDLARNLITGKVPKEIAGLDRFNVSSNHLCGQLPASKFPASAFGGNDCLCGSPLAPCKK